MPWGEHFAQLWFRNRSLEINQYNLPFFFTLSSFRKLISSTALDIESYILAETIHIRLKTRESHQQGKKKREDLFFLKKREGKKSLSKEIIMLLPGYENHDVTTCINNFCAGRKRQD